MKYKREQKKLEKIINNFNNDVPLFIKYNLIDEKGVERFRWGWGHFNKRLKLVNQILDIYKELENMRNG